MLPPQYTRAIAVNVRFRKPGSAAPKAPPERFQRIFRASSSQSHAVLITYRVLREQCFGAAQSHTYLEITMNTKAPVLNTKSFICIALLAACGVLSAPIQAKSHEVTVKITVSTAGLDLSQPAGAREAYARLQKAAGIACTHGMRVDLQPPASFAGCYEKTLGDAIRSANVPLLTQVYLETHSPREAAAHGIDVPVQVAAK